MEISLAEASSIFPGFRFSPTDAELIQFYLKKKLEGSEDDVQVIPEIVLCVHEPWDLPGQSVIKSDNEWFFFSRRGRKYPNGSQSKRATDSGFWKATGKERNVKLGSSNIIGTKRTLVFHTGRAPKGQRTEWIMHEYCTNESSQDSMVVFRLRKNKKFQLNDMNARTDELVDTDAYESHEKITNESPPRYSSGSKVNEEEDYYTDIMKDDIISLDDTSPQTRSLSERTSQDHDWDTTSRHPFQGTANQRLRLGIQRTKSSRAKASGKLKFDKESLLINNMQDSSFGRGPKSMMHWFPRLRIVVLCLVTLILIALSICS